MLPHYLQNLPLYHNTAIHDHATRIQFNIHQPKASHEYAKKCIRYDLSLVINSTPKIIIEKISTHSLAGFAGYIK